MNVVGDKPKAVGGKALANVSAKAGADGTVARHAGQVDQSLDDKSFANAINTIDKQAQKRKEDDALAHFQANKGKIVPHPDVAALDSKLAQDKRNADDLRRIDSKKQKDELRRLADEREKKRLADDELRNQAIASQDAKVAGVYARPRMSTTAAN